MACRASPTCSGTRWAPGCSSGSAASRPARRSASTVRTLRLYFVAGALGISIPVSLLAHVAPKLPASLVVMVTCLSPTCTYLIAMALRMERFRLLSTGGVALGLAGILILVVPGITLPNLTQVSWLLLAMLAPVCFASFNVVGAILWPPKAHSLGLACGIQMGGAVVLVPFMLGTGETYLFPGPLLAGDLAILGATGVTALVWYLIFEILRLGGPLFLVAIRLYRGADGIRLGRGDLRRAPEQRGMDRGRPPAGGARGAHLVQAPEAPVAQAKGTRMTIKLLQVDTFTETVLGGNPAAVCPLDAWLDDATMQAIAAENNLSETAFMVPEGEGYGLRWFTPNVEVDLCGHATLAAAFVVFEQLRPGSESVSFETLSGRLTVARDGEALVMDFPAQPAQPQPAPAALAQALGAAPAEVLAGADWIAVFERRGAGRRPQPRPDAADHPRPPRRCRDRTGRCGRCRLRAALLRSQERRARGPGDGQRADGARALLGGAARQETARRAPALGAWRADGVRGSRHAGLDRRPRGALHGGDRHPRRLTPPLPAALNRRSRRSGRWSGRWRGASPGSARRSPRNSRSRPNRGGAAPQR